MNALIAFALKHRVLMLTLCVIVFAGGLLAFRQLNIEAYPDPTPPMVDVITQSHGLSDVKLQFTFDYTYEEALQQVLNRLASLPPLLNNAQPQISPVSPIGEIFRYKLVGPPNYSVLDLKTLQDWVLQRRFRSVPGVGLILTIDDLSNTMLTQSGGNPVLVKDVATVTVGNQPRLGIAGRDGDDDIVQGIVLMRRGEQSMPTIQRVHAEIDRINSTGVLPPGVRIERIYDRKDLIDVTTRTVLHNMVFGIGLIFLLQWVFLGNFRSAIIVGATIPFALAFAVGILVIRGESANLLSV